jgi:hypothetical protein
MVIIRNDCEISEENKMNFDTKCELIRIYECGIVLLFVIQKEISLFGAVVEEDSS